MTTERYIRDAGQWVKITRDTSKRVFCIARGWNGDVSATDVRVWPFAFVPTWKDAEDLAAQSIKDHA